MRLWRPRTRSSSSGLPAVTGPRASCSSSLWGGRLDNEQQLMTRRRPHPPPSRWRLLGSTATRRQPCSDSVLVRTRAATQSSEFSEGLGHENTQKVAPLSAEAIRVLCSLGIRLHPSAQSSVHFVGIGGSGLAPLAAVALHQGWSVSGSDEAKGSRTEWIKALGAHVSIGHRPGNLSNAMPDVVVASSAVPGDNEELMAARESCVPVLKRSDWLRVATAGHRLAAVAGTHGKTTTSAMLAAALSRVLLSGGEEEWAPPPLTAVVGGDVPQFPGGRGILLPAAPSSSSPSGASASGGGGGGGGTPKEGGWFVLEADEYDHAFIGLAPEVAVLTNVELDHVDCYPDEDAVREAFLQFVGQVDASRGLLLWCGDDPGARDVVSGLLLRQQRQLEAAEEEEEEPPQGASGWGCCPRAMSYGFNKSCDWVAVPRPDEGSIAQTSSGGSSFDVLFRGVHVAEASLELPGRHNVLNALAAAAAASFIASMHTYEGGPDGAGGSMEASARVALRALEGFRGSTRRFERIGGWEDPLGGGRVEVVDDYAHHPTEVSATIAAARELWPPGGGTCTRLVAVFQPHTHSRLDAFATGFAAALAAADDVVVLDVFDARAGLMVGPPKVPPSFEGEKGPHVSPLDLVELVRRGQRQRVDEQQQLKVAERGGSLTAQCFTGPVRQCAEPLARFVRSLLEARSTAFGAQPAGKGDSGSGRVPPDVAVILLGAGDITAVGPEVLSLLRRDDDNST